MGREVVVVGERVKKTQKEKRIGRRKVRKMGRKGGRKPLTR